MRRKAYCGVTSNMDSVILFSSIGLRSSCAFKERAETCGVVIGGYFDFLL